SEEEVAAMEAEQRRQAAARAMDFQHAQSTGYDPMPQPGADGEGQQAGAAVAAAAPMVRNGPKVGRNDPCPCGSGKKYKHCHGALN
ncbi:MAG: SEC-C domain-containing protein, partial [Alphaproteobacteria bacterium]|nr:SEC-C domain-containing protein [Alphaproteobacteria bacterium]